MSLRNIEIALAFLRANPHGELRCDGALQKIKFVFAGDGSLAAPTARGTLEAVDTVLFVPDYRDEAMEVQCALSPLQAAGADAAVRDRWRIYFGEPTEPIWAKLVPQAARHQGLIIDGEALMQPSALAADKPALCNDVNRLHVDDLRRVVARATRVHIEQPIMVGIDSGGVDVRARFGIIRLAFSRPIATAAEARAALERLFAPEGALMEDEPA